MCETRSQREPSLVSEEEGPPEPKALRHGGGCEYSLGRARKARLGGGLPVTWEWNAHYYYLDSKEWDSRRLENMKRLRLHMWYFNNPERWG